MICGWSHGRFDARHWQTGEVVFKEKLDAQHSIVALLVDDWLQMGHAQLIICSQLGQGNLLCKSFFVLVFYIYPTYLRKYLVWSYLPSDLELTSLDRIKDENATQAEEEAIRRLIIRKQNLLAELEHIRHHAEHATVAETVDDEVQLTVKHDQENVLLELEGGGLIHAVIIFAEGLFPNGESHALHLCPPSSSAKVSLPVQRNLAVDLHVNILLESHSSNDILKVVEVVHPLPTFSRFKSVPWPSRTKNPSALHFRVRIRLQERIQRVIR